MSKVARLEARHYASPEPTRSTVTHSCGGPAVEVGVAQLGVVVAVIRAVLCAGAHLVGTRQAANTGRALDLRAAGDAIRSRG